MVKQLYNVDIIEFARWTVVLEKIKNSPSGAPRYEATVIYDGQDRGMDRAATKYRFTGHYYSEREEAEFILEHHLKEHGYGVEGEMY